MHVTRQFGMESNLEFVMSWSSRCSGEIPIIAHQQHLEFCSSSGLESQALRPIGQYNLEIPPILAPYSSHDPQVLQHARMRLAVAAAMDGKEVSLLTHALATVLLHFTIFSYIYFSCIIDIYPCRRYSSSVKTFLLIHSTNSRAPPK